MKFSFFLGLLSKQIGIEMFSIQGTPDIEVQRVICKIALNSTLLDLDTANT